ncbi:carbohydrate porin [Saccharibacter floricola]|uniref:Carbohydrate-selective porin B n=1 Tax=Saccharibacter floricola DSM 15669 TaxID=1123227 RepID=A0ABQ0P0L8_9PROT|nr:carbohydrate porin [Saccharibacter floricola]GBQ08313.1 carbohydrate-selective porin B [Saccharibacter floricola DSM 15669]
MFRKSFIIATTLAVLCTFFSHAQAQVLDRIIGNEPYERVDTPLPLHDGFTTAVPPFARPEALFPHGFGMTDWLRDRGIAFLLDNMNEFAGAITKPTPGFPNYKQGASNAGQYAMSLNIDWERILGLRGFSTHSIAVGRYGTTANRMFGDWLNHASEDYGGGGNVVVHLVMLYGEETLWGGRLDIAAGRMAEMSDFQNSPLFCNFQNGSICGRPKAATDSSFTSGYPASVWGGRIRGRPWRSIYVQAGVYAAERGIYSAAEHRTGFAWLNRHINGVRVPFEIGFEPVFYHAYPGHLKIGGVLMTAPSADNYFDRNGAPFALSRLAPRTHRNNFGAWIMADQHIMNHYHNNKRGITVLGGFLYNDRQTALREWEAYGAVIDRGIFRSRPYDTLGISFTYEKMPIGVQKTGELLIAQNRPLPNHATGVQRHTSVFEVNYAIHVMRGVIFQPLMEYYFRPNGQGNLRDAALLGFKSHIEIF